MKTRVFLSALALAMLTVAFLYNTSYSGEKSCSCTNCVCVSCNCSEANCSAGNCSNCCENNCCAAGNCEMKCCASKNNAGGAAVSASCCCTDCKCDNCTCATNCCGENGCKGCKDNKCCTEGKCKDASCCKDSKTTGGVPNDELVCVVSGEKIEKGKEIVFSYLNKDYKFCCENCVKSFKTEPIKYVKETLNCPVMNEPVKESVFTMHNDTKYYFCCKMCIKDFKADPDKYLKKNETEPKNDK